MELLIALIPLLLGGCPSPPSGRDAFLTPKDVIHLELSVPASASTTVCHVVLLEEGIGKEWLLQFRKHNGVVVVGADQTAPRDSMTIAEYASALENALSGVEQRFPDRRIDQVQLDVKLVDEAWRDVVATTKSQASKLRGLVHHKDRTLFRAVLEALSTSKLMSITCDVLRRHRYSCEDQIGLNPIAFKTEHLGKKWTTLRSLDDAGLNETMSLGIHVKR
jgi:hypothetical protein